MPATHIDLKFADGTYRCALGLAQIHEIQDKCGAGIGAIYARVLQGRVEGDIAVGHPLYAGYSIDDLVETMRQGLIGGGKAWVDGKETDVGALRANDLIERYFLPLPLSEQWSLAAAILYAKVEGYEDKEAPPRARDKKKVTAGLATPTH